MLVYTPDDSRPATLRPDLLDVPPLLLRGAAGAAVAEDAGSEVGLRLFGGLVDVHRAGGLLGDAGLGEAGHDHAAVAVGVVELDEVALPDGGGGLDALAVDLDVAAAAGFGSLAPVLEEADELEPVIDAVSFGHVYNRGMIKADIVNKVAEVSEISRVKAAQAVDTVIEGLRNALGRGQRIELRGFGVFQVKQRKKGIGRNPKTGVEVKIPPGNTIRFKPGKELRNLL